MMRLMSDGIDDENATRSCFNRSGSVYRSRAEGGCCTYSINACSPELQTCAVETVVTTFGFYSVLQWLIKRGWPPLCAAPVKMEDWCSANTQGSLWNGSSEVRSSRDGCSWYAAWFPSVCKQHFRNLCWLRRTWSSLCTVNMRTLQDWMTWIVSQLSDTDLQTPPLRVINQFI